MDKAQKQIVESIEAANNVLVALSKSPSVDELAAAISLTLLLDALDKRSTAIFSGKIPAAIEFLDPEHAFEEKPDSLRDFIIALSKDKADHLRYKVEGDVVRVFITPYKTTLSQADLEFSQGDYNVDLVIALGVKDQANLDTAMDAHGKILHDAKVITISTGEEASNLGIADWHDKSVSSLSEMIGQLAEMLDGGQNLMNEELATAILTGIVAATNRFSNERTTTSAMNMAGKLMASGANQQLIANELSKSGSVSVGEAKSVASGATDASELFIERDDKSSDAKSDTPEAPKEDLDAANQAELENKLAEITKPGTTIANLEDELNSAASEPVGASLEDKPQLVDEVTGDNSSSAPADGNVVLPPPGFGGLDTNTDTAPVAEQPTLDTPALPTLEPSGDIVPPAPELSAPPVDLNPAPVVDTPVLPSVEPTQAMAPPSLPPLPTIGGPEDAPQELGNIAPVPPELPVIQNHGSVAPSTGAIPAINESQAPSDPGPMFNPMEAFNTEPVQPQPEVATAVGDVQSPAGGGTNEGMNALMAAPESLESPADGIQALPASPAGVSDIPSLPPLPNMSGDAGIPLPPPPPAPSGFSVPPSAPAGAVSGDVFGDSAQAGPAPAPAEQPVPAGPGVFQIPGQ